MRSATKIFLASLIAVFMSVPLWAAASPAQTVNLPPISAGYAIDDEDQPEVTARVARISYLGGEAKIRRAGLDDWEVATLNLPLVEGDEIVTDAGGRVEIQFDKSTHLRLSENAYLKLITLKDEAVAVSLSLGSMNLRLRSFDREISSFEIDAPKTTVAIQKSGSYRIDAGRDGDNEIRIAAREGGEARIFSDTSAFTLKNGRSARVFINGQNSGEWNLADASRYQDDFDEWTSDRDSVIASQLKDAHYDTYYDSDLYGADDLSGHGERVYI
ncbi:MAG: FecR domain-containing protein, partial [Pyrinomonadaceae bacterium]